MVIRELEVFWALDILQQLFYFLSKSGILCASNIMPHLRALEQKAGTFAKIRYGPSKIYFDVVKLHIAHARKISAILIR